MNKEPTRCVYEGLSRVRERMHEREGAGAQGASRRRQGKKESRERKEAQGGTAIPARMHGLEGGQPDRLVGRHVHAAQTRDNNSKYKWVSLRGREGEREAAPQNAVSEA